MADIQLTATVNYDQNKVDALRMYLKQNDSEFQKTLDKAMITVIDALYKKSVPTQVQSFISLMNGDVVASAKKAKPKKQKPLKEDEQTIELPPEIEQYPNVYFKDI